MNKKKNELPIFAYTAATREFAVKAEIYKVAFIWKYSVIYLLFGGWSFGDATIQFRNWEITYRNFDV